MSHCRAAELSRSVLVEVQEISNRLIYVTDNYHMAQDIYQMAQRFIKILKIWKMGQTLDLSQRIFVLIFRLVAFVAIILQQIGLPSMHGRYQELKLNKDHTFVLFSDNAHPN